MNWQEILLWIWTIVMAFLVGGAVGRWAERMDDEQ